MTALKMPRPNVATDVPPGRPSVLRGEHAGDRRALVAPPGEGQPGAVGAGSENEGVDAEVYFARGQSETGVVVLDDLGCDGAVAIEVTVSGPVG
jgi:hypothetical protein